MGNDRIPSHALLDIILGLNIRDLILKTREDVEAFKKQLQKKRAKLRARRTAEKARSEKKEISHKRAIR